MLKLEELIGKTITIDALYNDHRYVIRGKLIKVEKDHLIFKERHKSGKTYLNRSIEIVVINIGDE